MLMLVLYVVNSKHEGAHYSYDLWRPWLWLSFVLLIENLINLMVNIHAHGPLAFSILSWHWRSYWCPRSTQLQEVQLTFLIHACSPDVAHAICYYSCYPTFKMKVYWIQCYMLWIAIMMASIILISLGDPGYDYDWCCCLRISSIPGSILMPTVILRYMFWDAPGDQIDVWDPCFPRKVFWYPCCMCV